MNETVVIAGVFLLTLLLFGAIGAAVSFVGGSDKAVRRRLQDFRARYAPGSGPGEPRSIRVGEHREKSAVEAFLGSLVPRRDIFRKRLQETGRDIAIGRYVAISAGVGVLVALFLALGAGAPWGLALVGGVAGGFALPHMYISRLIKKRRTAFLTRFPDAIDLIVRGLKSGLPVNETMVIVGAEIDDPVGAEFRNISDQVRLGKTLDEALWRAAERLDVPDFKFFVISLAIQRETGGNLAETLANLSNILRQRQQMKLKIRALSSEGRASALIIGVLPFVMFGIIYAMNPDYMSAFFTDPRAETALVGALIWMGLGGLIIKKMINFEI
ncbi:MAG: type II secretion system F family protein [Rhodothalassiaceae bacterium]